jgi:hypothetical protein
VVYSALAKKCCDFKLVRTSKIVIFFKLFLLNLELINYICIAFESKGNLFEDKIYNLFSYTQYWPVRLGVRTPGFHPGNRGSIPLRATSSIVYYKVKKILARSSRG